MAEPLLQTIGLEKRFGGVRAIAGVDFRLEPGELRCLIGPNGAGKSTFFKMLTGQHQPTAGRILFDGRDITGAEPHRIGRLGIGIKNQVPDVLNGLTVRENLELAASFRRRKAAVLILERLHLMPIAERKVAELAHGQRQWVEIGMVMACEPRLILLDEPSAGMSADETAETATLIRELNRMTTIVVVEHDMQFIGKIASKVTVFHQGRILREDSFAAIVRDPVVRDVYLGRRVAV
jgi:branched-chain amino acid transport system ATP-binding protein/urea transport system ATP-binding protein